MKEDKIRGLKQCPFCGGNDIEISSEEVYIKSNSGLICMTCKDCGTDVYRFGDAETDYDDAVKEAIAKWNTRTKAWDEP